MTTPEVQPHDHPHPDKAIDIIVNGRKKTVADKKLTFEEVVSLALENPFSNPQTVYSVTYKRGPDANHEGSMVQGGKPVSVKDGMIFNVSATTQS